MSELDVNLAGKSLADYANTQLRLALGAVLYTNTADMWRRYLNQCGYSGDLSYMLQKYYVDYSVPLNFRNYISAGAFVGFSPRSLFTGSDVGVWYDLDDNMDAKIAWVAANGTGGFLTAFPDHALFQDSAGTTPVTGVGQPLGLVLDKSKGLVRGADIALNGDFNSGAGWTLGAGITISGGNLNINASSGTAVNDGGGITVAGAGYETTIIVSSISGGSIYLGGGIPSVVISVAGTYVIPTVASSNNFIVIGVNSGSPIAVVSSVSRRTLAGNHRTQATAANRPLWGARKNWAIQTNDLANAAWTKLNITVAGGSADPDGGTTAYKLTGTAANARLEQFFPTGIGLTQNVQSFWIRRVTGTGQISTFNGGAYVPLTVTSSWTRVSQASVASPASSYLMVRIEVSGDEVEVWHPQIEYGSTATRYQRVTTATDYDAAGFPKFATYDSVNDTMATASIDFTATDKMTVCAGITRLSDASQMMVAELSASLAANNGSFYLAAPNSAAANHAFASKGTVSATDIETSAAAPLASVLTGIGDIGGDSALLRRNGVAGTAVTTDQGAGNFSNNPMYFGARAGTSLYFNGQENQFFIINKLLTAPQIAQLESYIANKTGVTL